MTNAERLDRLSGLYGIVDDDPATPLSPVSWAEALAAGGASSVQLRFKHTPARAALAVARAVRRALPRMLLIIDDRPDLAVLADADGVHVGEEDLSPSDARRIVGPDRLVGATARTVERARAVLQAGADHLGVGPVYMSTTKSLPVTPLGPDGSRRDLPRRRAGPRGGHLGHRHRESGRGDLRGSPRGRGHLRGGTRADPEQATRNLAAIFRGPGHDPPPHRLDRGPHPRSSHGVEFSRSELRVAYSDAVASAGGIPLILPYAAPEATGLSASALPATLERLDGLILTGGAFDVPPWLYGETPRDGLGTLKPERTELERQAFLRARELGLPTLAICGGMQLVNVLLGGSLYQHLPFDAPDALDHEQSFDRRKPSHPIEVLPETRLAQILGRSGGFPVNSSHHQAVKRLGESLRVSARGPDDLIEAFEDTNPDVFLIGVEWHPELLVASRPEQRGLFHALVAACAGHSRG